MESFYGDLLLKSYLKKTILRHKEVLKLANKSDVKVNLQIKNRQIHVCLYAQHITNNFIWSPACDNNS